MDSSASFSKTKQYIDVYPSFVPNSRRDHEANRNKNICLKKSATFSYLLLQLAIIIALVTICVLPFWLRCHFFLLTPEHVNQTAPNFFDSKDPNPFSVFSGKFAAQKLLLAKNSILENASNVTAGNRLNVTSTEVPLTSSRGKSRRRSGVEIAPSDANSSSASEPEKDDEHIFQFGRDNSRPMLRRYITADIGLWETCQLGHCQRYAPIQNLFFEINPSIFWLFISRWLCTSGVGLMEIAWLIVAIVRFIRINKQRFRRPIISRNNKNPLDVHLHGFNEEPITGAMLLIIKAMTICAIIATLVSFRWHTNSQWPNEWRSEKGVIAHMGVSWLGMLALGACDAWLFFVTLLHTIAARRDLRKAEYAVKAMAARALNTNVIRHRARSNSFHGGYSKYNSHVPPSCHHADADNSDYSSVFMSPTSNCYKPAPYDGDYTSSLPMARNIASRQSSRYGADRCQTSQRHANHCRPNAANLTCRTPGHKHHPHQTPRCRVPVEPLETQSPLYVPHYDDEVIGGRAFY